MIVGMIDTHTTDDIRRLRALAGLTQAAAGEMVYAAPRTWRQWEAGDARMPRATLELWCIAMRSADLISESVAADFVRPDILARL